MRRSVSLILAVLVSLSGLGSTGVASAATSPAAVVAPTATPRASGAGGSSADGETASSATTVPSGIVLSGVVPSGTAPKAASVAPTDPPITLAGGRALSECVNSNPKPGCSTSRTTDSHQLAVLGSLLAGMVFIGWRITRGVRRKHPLRPAP